MVFTSECKRVYDNCFFSFFSGSPDAYINAETSKFQVDEIVNQIARLWRHSSPTVQRAAEELKFEVEECLKESVLATNSASPESLTPCLPKLALQSNNPFGTKLDTPANTHARCQRRITPQYISPANSSNNEARDSDSASVTEEKSCISKETDDSQELESGALQQLREMGFQPAVARMVLEATNNDVEEAINRLIGMSF